jgi:hypothetical protein
VIREISPSSILSSVHGRDKSFLFSTAFRPALGPTQPPIQQVLGALSSGVKQQGHEADHFFPFNAKVKKCGVYLHILKCLRGIVLN